jgi:hypothetical protein
MDIVIVLRCVKRDKKSEFLKSYAAQTPKSPDFIRETLTELNSSADLPPALRSLPLGCNCENCITYLNIAEWRSAAAFVAEFSPTTTHNPDIECCDRLRLVLTSRASHENKTGEIDNVAIGRNKAAKVAEAELRAAEK